MPYHESPDQTGKAPKHQRAALKSKHKKFSNAPVQLLTVEDHENITIVSKELKARNPIEEIQNIRRRYQGEFAFIREALQNSSRSGRDNGIREINVNIEITPNHLQITDNAGGVNKGNIDKIFSLGQSGWGANIIETEDPFGQGFMSSILIFNKITVISNDVKAEFDWGNIEREYNEKGTFDLSHAYSVAEAASIDHFGMRNKFKVILEDPTENWDSSSAISEVNNVAQYFGFHSVLINGEEINLQSFSETPSGFFTIKKTSRGTTVVEGYIHPGTLDNTPMTYFNGAPVSSLHTLDGIIGEINITHRQYGEPTENRDAWRQSTERSGIILTENLIRSKAHEIAIDLVKYGTDNQIKEHEAFITTYAEYSEYKRHVQFHLIGFGTLENIKKMVRSQNPNQTDYEFNEHIENIMSSQSKLMQAAEEAKLHTEETPTEYKQRQENINKRRDEARRQLEEEPDKEEKDLIEDELTSLDDEEKTLDEENKKDQEDFIKFKKTDRDEAENKLSSITKITFWVKTDEMMHYAENIAQAEYYGYQIAIAHNKLQRKVFENETQKFFHISHFEFSEKRETNLKSVGPKNKKERRLQWVFNTFLQASKYADYRIHIASFTFTTHLTIPGTNITETKHDIDAAAFAQGSDIYIEREVRSGQSADGAISGYYGVKTLYPYLEYNEFDLSNKTIGWGDITAFLKVLTLISHELAHVAYGTKDNTKEHLEAMTTIEAEFDTIIAEHRGKTTLSTGKSVPKSIAKDLNITPSDTVALTFFEGTSEEIEKIKKEKLPTFKKGDYVIIKNTQELGVVMSVEDRDNYRIRAPDGEETLSSQEIEHSYLKPGSLYTYNDQIAYITRIGQFPLAYIYNSNTDTDPEINISISDWQNLQPVSREFKKDFTRNILLTTFSENRAKLSAFTHNNLLYYTQDIYPMDNYSAEYALYHIVNDVVTKESWKHGGKTVYTLDTDKLDKALK